MSNGNEAKISISARMKHRATTGSKKMQRENDILSEHIVPTNTRICKKSNYLTFQNSIGIGHKELYFGASVHLIDKQLIMTKNY